MRRPAHRRTIPAITSTWVHPYTGATALGVFYNDGGDPPEGPTPAAMPKKQPTAKPKPPSSDLPGLADGEMVVHRDWLEQRLSGEKDSGRRNGNQRLAADLGFDDVMTMRAYVEEKRQADQAQLSEAERRTQELEERERQIATREAQAEARITAANRRALLVGLGATGADLDDATALLRVENDATDDDVQAAAQALKDRRPELFGLTPPDQSAKPAMPPAPGGAPAGGPPARQTPTGKPGDRGRAIAQSRGHRPAA